jgi:hypothetical protein
MLVRGWSIGKAYTMLARWVERVTSISGAGNAIVSWFRYVLERLKPNPHTAAMTRQAEQIEQRNQTAHPQLDVRRAANRSESNLGLQRRCACWLRGINGWRRRIAVSR